MLDIEARLKECKSFEELLGAAMKLQLGSGLEASADSLRTHAQNFREWVRVDLLQLIREYEGATIEDLLDEADVLLRGRHMRELCRVLLTVLVAHFVDSESQTPRTPSHAQTQ